MKIVKFYERETCLLKFRRGSPGVIGVLVRGTVARRSVGLSPALHSRPHIDIRIEDLCVMDFRPATARRRSTNYIAARSNPGSRGSARIARLLRNPVPVRSRMRISFYRQASWIRTGSPFSQCLRIAGELSAARHEVSSGFPNKWSIIREGKRRRIRSTSLGTAVESLRRFRHTTVLFWNYCPLSHCHENKITKIVNRNFYIASS